MTGEEIRKYRLKLGMSQEAFGLAIGARASQVSRWETNQTKMGKLYLEKVQELGVKHGL